MEDLQKQLNELKERIDQLSDSSKIPYETEQAFKERLSPVSAVSLGTFTAISRDITINSTPATIQVLKDPAGYLLIKYKENTYKVPYFID